MSELSRGRSAASQSEPQLRRTAQQREPHSSIGGSANNGAASLREAPTKAIDGNYDPNKPPPMGPVTKAILGILIAILIFNLYLRPLLGVALGSGAPAPAPAPP